MRIWIAIKAFFKALKAPAEVSHLLDVLNSQQLQEKKEEEKDLNHLHLLRTLQSSGRLIDFLKEDISSFEDEQVGAAARQVHQECAQILEELVTIRPILDAQEGSTIEVKENFAADTFKLTGNVHNSFPLTGVVVHRGWKALKRSLPKNIKESTKEIIEPAEIEIR